MKLTEDEEAICQKYSEKGDNRRVHCSECPLVRASEETDIMCKAIGHYDKSRQTWVPDEWMEEEP